MDADDGAGGVEAIVGISRVSERDAASGTLGAARQAGLRGIFEKQLDGVAGAVLYREAGGGGRIRCRRRRTEAVDFDQGAADFLRW